MSGTVTKDDVVPVDSVVANYEPADYQKALMYDQALSSWSARNRITEALVVRIAQCIAKGEDTAKLLDALDRISKPDAFTEKVLNNLV